MSARDMVSIPASINLIGRIDMLTHVYNPVRPKIGYSDGYDDGYAQALLDIPPPDENAPVITWVSPTPGAAPGSVGGFPRSPSVAKTFPVVIQIGDVDPGVQYVNVVVVYTDGEGNTIEETIYRRSNFRGLYVKGSKAEMVGGNLQLTIKRNSENGWLDLINGATRQFAMYADAVDSVGNVNEEE